MPADPHSPTFHSVSKNIPGALFASSAISRHLHKCCTLMRSHCGNANSKNAPKLPHLAAGIHISHRPHDESMGVQEDGTCTGLGAQPA
jgi:hypothetical protein